MPSIMRGGSKMIKKILPDSLRFEDRARILLPGVVSRLHILMSCNAPRLPVQCPVAAEINSLRFHYGIMLVRKRNLKDPPCRMQIRAIQLCPYGSGKLCSYQKGWGTSVPVCGKLDYACPLDVSKDISVVTGIPRYFTMVLGLHLSIHGFKWEVWYDHMQK
jgi:hypothetical protein